MNKYRVIKPLPGANVGDIIAEEPGDFMDQNLYKAGVDEPIVHRSQIEAALRGDFIEPDTVKEVPPEHPKTFSELLDDYFVKLDNWYRNVYRNTPTGNPEISHSDAKAALLQAHREAVEQADVRAEIKGKRLALEKMRMGAGEYHDDPYEYVVPLCHIKEYEAELAVFDLSDPTPIFREKQQLRHSTNHIQEGGK